jgi:hypothetical protein
VRLPGENRSKGENADGKKESCQGEGQEKEEVGQRQAQQLQRGARKGAPSFFSSLLKNDFGLSSRVRRGGRGICILPEAKEMQIPRPDKNRRSSE